MSGDRPEETAAEPEPRLVTSVHHRRRLAVAPAARQANTQTTIAMIHETERRGLSSNQLLTVAAQHWPQPRLVPEPAEPGNAGWSAAPRWVAGYGPSDRAARPSAGRAGAPAVTGPLAQRRQRPRRRITPNANTSTTTMISTHNHVDMAASLVGAGQFAVTLLPPTRASNSVTATRPPGPLCVSLW
jgi:hypothetical protein